MVFTAFLTETLAGFALQLKSIGIELHREDKDWYTPKSLEGAHRTIKNANEQMDKYKEHGYSVYKETRNYLGEELIKVADDDDGMLTTYTYLLKLGAPITYDGGAALIAGVKRWDHFAIEHVNSKRLLSTYERQN